MNILKEHLLENVQEGDLFQHDNAPAHKLQKTARFLVGVFEENPDSYSG